MNERRDYDGNGRGRRDYDNSMESFCLHCDLRKEMNSKVSWKLFILIIGGILTISGTILGIGTNIAAKGAERMLNTSQETLTAIHGIGERTARIEARQELIMNKVDDLDSGR